jgi:hypothetical protein
MKSKLIFILSFVCFFCINTFSQDSINKPVQRNISNFNVGLGLGMDFGGIGGNLTIYAQDHIGGFIGLGYNIVNLGINAGLKYRILPKGEASLFTPFFIGMYGYNAAIAVANAPDLNKIFYGPSFGFGFDWKGYAAKSFLWSIAIIVPIRSADVQNYIDNLKSNYGVEFKNDLIPIGLSFGVRF